MNAGRDVERLIAGWLEEEAQAGAPVRVLESIRLSIDRTMQRRWLAAWRERMTFTMPKVAALAASLVLALAGAAWIGRSTAPGVGEPADAVPTSSPMASMMAPAVSLEAYKEARGEICVRYRSQINPLKSEVGNLFDRNLSAEDRADGTVALATTGDRIEAMAGELAALAVPPELVDEHRANVSNFDAIVVLIRASLAKLQDGDVAGAEASDRATDAFNEDTAQYELKYRLLACP